MKAAVLRQIRAPLVLEEVADPVIGPDDLLVQTRACGICGTDVHIQDGWGYTPALPFVMGHEPSGVVMAAGTRVTGFSAGDRVVPNIFFSCGNCYYCRINRETQCLQLDGILGVLSHWGGYGAYFRVPARQVFQLPQSVPFVDGAVIADAVVTAVHAVQTGRVAPGEAVVIIGIGGCGGSAVQVCKAYGAQVIAVDRGARKQGHALALGADEALDAALTAIPAAVRALTGGVGAQCVIDAVGNAETLRMGVESLGRGGRLVVLGYTQERYALDPRQVAVNELAILGTRSGGRQCTVEAFRLVAGARWRSIVSDVLPVSRVNDALALVRSGAALGRVVLSFEEA
ncbi:MAG TPA: alcohol dehydrogenase catalytic domain-containing protein [Chloroflexota bacterium]|nr:alcohol dehydrogenase catalytic domain-containing protein [Chloroflexota bacterium]